MAFDEVRMPEDVAEGAEGGPQFSTVVIRTDSGAEQRIAQWSQGLRRWRVGHDLRTPAQRNALVAFFAARGGRARGFRFKDWSDYAVTTPAATGALTAATFQLQKAYTSGGVTHTRTITKPVSGTTRLWNPSTGAEISGGGTVDTTTGIVTFAVAPGFTPNATFEFDVPDRFDTDTMAGRQAAPGVWSWSGVPIVEVRV